MTLSIDLTNFRAVVTGVSSGIGAGIAQALARTGCDVAGCGLGAENSDGAQRFLANAHQQGRRAFYQAVDLTDGAAARLRRMGSGATRRDRRGRVERGGQRE